MSFQEHQMIPKKLFETSQLLKDLKKDGRVSQDGSSNLVTLPEDLDAAEKAGMARHLGSHPAYSQFVKKIIDRIETQYIEDLANNVDDALDSAVEKIELTQFALKLNLNSELTRFQPFMSYPMLSYTPAHLRFGLTNDWFRGQFEHNFSKRRIRIS